MRTHRWLGLLLLLTTGCQRSSTPLPRLVLWAWERPEDVRFADGAAEIAAEVGSVVLNGDAVMARGRRFSLLTSKAPSTNVVHVEIAPDRPLVWTPALRAQAGAAILHYATRIPAPRVQIDFEVRASQRRVLLDVIDDLRRDLPRGTALSMTALASWCGENWLGRVPVDEVVPMLFRMGPGGAPITAALTSGRDLRDPRCHGAIGVATDTPLARAPLDRRVYLFDPHSWTIADFARAKHNMEGWR